MKAVQQDFGRGVQDGKPARGLKSVVNGQARILAPQLHDQRDDRISLSCCPSFGAFQGQVANVIFTAAERKAGQVTTQLFLTISIWYQAGILADMQVQAMNGLYVIQSVENISELDVVLVLNCIALSQNE